MSFVELDNQKLLLEYIITQSIKQKIYGSNIK